MGQNRRYGDPLTALDAPAVPPPSPSRIRHVWINLSNLKQAPSIHPGLIIDWRQSERGWEAQVAHVATSTDGTSSLHVSWVAANKLRPAIEPST